MHKGFSQDDSSSCESPFIEPTDKGKNRRIVLGLAGVWAFVLVICIVLVASSALAFLTTCNADPSRYWDLQAAGAEASEYWEAKYGEAVEVVSVEYERVPSSLFPTVTEDIIIETSEGWRIFKRTEDGLMSDNRQAKEINLALEGWLESAFQQAAGASDTDGISWVRPIGLYPSQAMEGQAGSDSSSDDMTELSDESPTLLFNTWKYAEDSSDVSWSGFTTFYDGDLEAFLEAAAQTRELEISSDYDIIMAIDDTGEGGAAGADPLALPSGYSEERLPAWAEHANELAHTLDFYFSARPQITVMYESAAESQLQSPFSYYDSVYILGWYESRSEVDFGDEQAEEVKPVAISWVALDGVEGLFVASAEEGCVLEDEDVSLEVRSDIGQASINAALLELDDPTIELLGEVWSLRIADEAKECLAGPDGQSSEVLLYAAAEFKAAQGVYGWDEIPLDEGWSNFPVLYSFEVAGITEAGALEVGTSTTSYGITPTYLETLTYDTIYVQDTNDLILLFEAKSA